MTSPGATDESSELTEAPQVSESAPAADAPAKKRARRPRRKVGKDADGHLTIPDDQLADIFGIELEGQVARRRRGGGKKRGGSKKRRNPGAKGAANNNSNASKKPGRRRPRRGKRPASKGGRRPANGGAKGGGDSK